MLTSVLLILLTLLFSAFFSGMEIAFTSKNRLKLELDRKQNRLFDRIAAIFERHPGQYLTTILVGNNIALVLYSLYMSLLMRGLFRLAGWGELAESGSILIETGVSTLLIIFVGEFLPKSIFKNKSELLLSNLCTPYLVDLCAVVPDCTSDDAPFAGYFAPIGT